jgi:hypothetical protein
MDHSDLKCAKNIQSFLSKRSDPDLVGYHYSGSDQAKRFRIRPDLDPQHWLVHVLQQDPVGRSLAAH